MTGPIDIGSFQSVEDREPAWVHARVQVRRHDLRATWERCGTTADYVGSYLSVMFDDAPAAALQISCIANELLENAAKYAATADSAIILRARCLDRHVLIETQNPCHPSQARQLRVRVDQLDRHDPEELLLQQIRRSAQQAPASSGLGLIGLVRDYHGRLGLQVEPTEVPSVVCVTLQVWVDAITLGRTRNPEAVV